MKRNLSLALLSSILTAFLLADVPSSRASAQEVKNNPAASKAGAQEEPAAAAEPAPDGTGKHREQPKTLLEFALAGGWMMMPLGICSVLWVAFLVERLITLQRKRTVPVALAEGMRMALQSKPVDRERIRALLDSNPSAAARVLRAALDRLDQERGEAEKAVNNAAQREIYLLRRNVWIFAVVSSAAPLLGLLGTAVGLVAAFREVAISGLGSGANLAPGLYEALVTTIGGLAVAIPAIITYYWLHARVDQCVHEIDCMATDLVDAGSLAAAAV